MSQTESQNTLNALVEQHNKIMEEATASIRALVKNNFSQVTKYFFDACPEVKALSFTAYTPGFNDGDPCEFTIGELYAYNTEDVDIDNYHDDEAENVFQFSAVKTLRELNDPQSWAYGYYSSAGKLEETKNKYQQIIEEMGIPEERLTEIEAAVDSFESFIQKNSDILESLVGNNVFVVITRDEIRTEEYDCGY